MRFGHHESPVHATHKPRSKPRRYTGSVVCGLQHVARRTASDGPKTQEIGGYVQQRPRRSRVQLHGLGAQQAERRRRTGPGHSLRVCPGHVVGSDRGRHCGPTTATFMSRPLPLAARQRGHSLRIPTWPTALSWRPSATEGNGRAFFSNLAVKALVAPRSRRGSEE